MTNRFSIREATVHDATCLAQLRVLTDRETEYLDRDEGEGYLSPEDFKVLIKSDQQEPNNICLVACDNSGIIGYCRCEGNKLKRQQHQVIFGIAIRKDYWGNGIGKQMLHKVIDWAEDHQIHKINLSVLKVNKRAVALYETFGFQVEGCLKDDKRLRDGKLYDTLLMAWFNTKEYNKPST
ncbi:Protein N-acetyltransferase, RimJ/RimL family [Terribacillus aidingensis]|uniref:Protein N-acetyltransferase, RimJ/RimL family n=1 Tax=Terribacillus aidingensis TaxID=586416 RepID=A0A285P9N9_9BACI|nr:GNAT family N-acetyltransferase [Terribacillus aidingensis]SNZ18148.1 Protein N-acetyltransferase, RimJ/RimL family [Terribacillus aidingensis]